MSKTTVTFEDISIGNCFIYTGDGCNHEVFEKLFDNKAHNGSITKVFNNNDVVVYLPKLVFK